MFRLSLLTVLLAAPAWGSAQATPANVPGLGGRHPLAKASVGRLLMNELRCGACHEGMSVPPRGPDLSDVGRRVNSDYLKHFIANPARMQRGTKMPGRLHALEPGERDVVAEAITHFLVARCIRKGTAPPESSGAAGSAVVDGENLFHTIGCVACHAPRRPVPYSQEIPIAGGEAVNLEHIPAKYSVRSLAEFLFEPLRIRPSGRMPDMGLSRSEANAIASVDSGALFLWPGTAQGFGSEITISVPGAAQGDRLSD